MMLPVQSPLLSTAVHICPSFIRGFAVMASEQALPGSIWCVGRNFADHAKELGNAVPTTPMIFLKAGSCYLPAQEPLKLPSFSSDIHYEVELAVELGADLQPRRGAVSLDLTARDVQDRCKKSGHPWTLPKSFPNSCPVGSFFSLQGLDLSTLQLQLSVNGEVRQQGTTSDMIFSVPELLEWVKRHFPVRPGDLLLCGTPKGVGRLSVGDAIMANISCGGKVLSQGAWDVSQ